MKINYLKIGMVGCFGGAILLLLYVGFNLFFSVSAFSIDIPLKVEDKTYNSSEINQEIILEAQRYFYIQDYYDFEVVYPNKSVWWSSFSYHIIDGEEGEIDNEHINIGMSDISGRKELYEMVFTHEYMHYVLHKMGLMDRAMQEALVETYTWWKNEEVNVKIWGSDNSERSYPYDIIMDKILEEDNFKCLDWVFIETNKIDDVNEFLDRIEVECNVSKKYVEYMAYGDEES